MNDDGRDGESRALALLRQLSIGLGVYRLFPGDASWPPFVASVERIESAAVRALAEGRLEVQIRGRSVRTGEAALPDDELLGRLALACYERGAECLVVREPPDPTELSLLFRVLSLPADEVERLGGAPALLRGAGVYAVALGESGPSVTGESGNGSVKRVAFAAATLDPWARHSDPLAVAAGVFAQRAETERSSPVQILDEMEAVAATLPEDQLGPSVFHEHLVDMMLRLPDGPRRELLAHLIEQHARHGLAGRLVGIMSDAQLARALVDLAADGHDPMALAQTLADGPGGRTHLPALLAALMQGHEEAGTIMAVDAVGAVDERAWERSAPVLETVSDLLARDLKATESDDTLALQEEIARFEETQSLQAAVLADYLSLEGNGHRLGEALALWTESAREALRRRDSDALEGRLCSLEAAESRAEAEDPRRASAFDLAVRKVIDAQLAKELAEPGPNEEGAKALLVRLGPNAVDGLFDLLEVEPDRSVRTKLLALLRALPVPHHSRLAARLADPRWYVVRNAVNVLSRSSGPEALELITKASRHPTAAVRREAIQGLVAVGGDEAVPAIEALAHGDSEESVRAAGVVALGGLLSKEAVDALVGVARCGSTVRLRRLAIEQIAGHPSQAAISALRELASRRARPRVPRTLRSQARAAVKRREGGSP